MPGKLKVRIVAGRHLPVMDRASELTDAFVEVKFGTVTYKTEVCAKSLNPLWNSEWFKFEVDDELLQDEPLQIRVLDHDTYSAHDAIGKIYIDIDPLLHPDSSHFLGGWFPIYDTMHGIRGEILLAVKLELFADVNQFKQSSCGFKFLCGTTLPSCYQIQTVHGFVSDLIISEDPEYQWIEKLRTPRASNEARQRVFMKMSGELQRKIGSKVENVGGNAVVGYLQSYDIEGDSGIVVRAIGTAVTLKAAEKSRFPPSSLFPDLNKLNRSVQSQISERSFSLSQSFSGMKSKNIVDVHCHLSDFPFFTMTSYPPGVLQRISMVVCSRSIKLLEKVHNHEDWETREMWWDELRREIQAHCDALACNAVIGYKEETSICDDVIILSAEGTAAVVRLDFMDWLPKDGDINVDELYSEAQHKKPNMHECPTEAKLFQAFVDSSEHVPSMDYRTSPLDGTTPVPELLYSTIDIPKNIQYIGKGTLVQARYCRKLKKSQSEAFASLASDALPFIEYELHRRLHIKVKARGMNAVFGYRSTMTLGENLIVGVLTGTAVLLAALPRPDDNNSDNQATTFRYGCKEFRSNQFMELCRNMFELNEESLSIPVSSFSATPPMHHPEHPPASDKRSLFLELAGLEDFGKSEGESVVLRESLPPPHCGYSNLDICPGVEGFHEQSLSSLRRFRYDDADDEILNQGLACNFLQALDSLWFRLRRRNPICFITALRFQISIPDDDEVQIWITCSVLIKDWFSSNQDLHSNRCSAPPLLGDNSSKKLTSNNRSSSDLEMDSISIEEHKPTSFLRVRLSPLLSRFRKSALSANTRMRYNSTSSTRIRHPSDTSTLSEIDFNERNQGPVAITTMTHIPGRRIRRHIGLLNIFIVRETSAVRGSDETIPMAEPSFGTGSSWFVMRTLAEAQALIRSHVVALGGNSLTSYRSSYVVLKESLSKNEAQCLLHVIGDVTEFV